MNNSVTIRISRNKNIASDRNIAILKLNRIYHKVGQPVMVKYYTDQKTVDTVFALGTGDGIGESFYKVISLGGLELVSGVYINDRPDVVDLSHGELYLYRDSDLIWNYVYLPDGEVERVTIPITNLAPTVFVNIKDKYRWFWKNGELKREDDFFSGDEMEKVINDLYYEIGPPKLTAIITGGYYTKYPGYVASIEPGQDLFKVGEEINTLRVEVNVIDSLGNNLTSLCDFYVNSESTEKILAEESNETSTTTTSEPTPTPPPEPLLLKKFRNSQTDKYWVEIKDISESSVFIIEAKIVSGVGNTHTYSTAIKVDFGFDFYYGIVGENWVVNVDNIKKLNKRLTIDKTFNYNIESESLEDLQKLDLLKVVFAYPKAYGKLLHIYDRHHLDYIKDYNIYNVTINNLEYYIYVKIDAIKIDNFLQSFQFNEKDEEEVINEAYVDQVKYDEVLNAWDKRNTKDGLVVIGNNGKISEELLPGTEQISECAIVILVEILDTVPTGNLNPGDKWYITTEQKIYVATSAIGGELKDPSKDVIYFNKNDDKFYVWKTDTTSLIVAGGSVNSEIITDITDLFN